MIILTQKKAQFDQQAHIMVLGLISLERAYKPISMLIPSSLWHTIDAMLNQLLEMQQTLMVYSRNLSRRGY